MLLVAASTAMAQPGGGGRGGFGGGGFGGGGFGGGDFMSPGITTREIERYSSILNLSEEQSEIAQVLFEGYMEHFQNHASKVREKMEAAREEMRNGGDRTAWEGVRSSMDAFRMTSEELEAGFLSDMKAMLSSEQAAEWPRVERMRRRENTLGQGQISGERIDLIRLVHEELDLEEPQVQPLAPTLDQYEIELDRVLEQRNEAYEEVREAMQDGGFRAFFDGGDTGEMEKLFEKGRSASLRVRDLNRRFARQIEGMLPADRVEAFRAEMKRQSFPQVYRPVRGTQMIDAAMGFQDLSDEQRDAILSIRASMDRYLEGVRQQQIAIIEKREESGSIQDMFRARMRQGRGGGGDGEDNPEADLRNRT
ncbi:MAG: hypothetical protein KDA28_17765, partial [Phycisphaerales bacterium]|nr:hypothetical protein [Phycisphaerales bacterium]